MYKLLAARLRRLVLQDLIEKEVVTVENLVEYIVSHDSEQGDSNRDHIMTVLYHWHLPMLADAGLIEYDTQNQTVRYYGDQSVERLLNKEQYVEG